MTAEDKPIDHEARLGFEPDSQEPEFLRGIEAGTLNAKLRYIEDTFEEIVSAANYEMLRRMADAAGRLFQATLMESDEQWMMVTVYPRGYVIKKQEK